MGQRSSIMQRLVRLLVGVGMAMATLHAQGPASSYTPQGLPTEITQVRFNAGQSVVPYFEGWIKNADATFDMVFGYFNRNYQQEFAIPVGPENKVEPMTGDAGQPTYFLPRRQRWAYRVKVPANFGKQSLVWTITSNGRTEKAYGELIPAQEINERVVMTNGNFNPGVDDPNQPPTLTVASTISAKVGAPVTLTVAASDDGLPKPRQAPAPKPVETKAGRQPVRGGPGQFVGAAATAWLECQLDAVSRSGEGLLRTGDRHSGARRTRRRDDRRALYPARHLQAHCQCDRQRDDEEAGSDGDCHPVVVVQPSRCQRFMAPSRMSRPL